MPPQPAPQQLTSFISCSFHKEDQERVVKPLLDLVSNCGIDPRPLHRMPEAGRHTDVIVESIKRHRLFIAIVTKRDMPVVSAGLARGRGKRRRQLGFRTAPLIIQEIGIACAFGKPIVVFRENGVDPEDLGLAHGVSEVEFRRDTLRKQLGKSSELRDTMERLLGSARRNCLDASQMIDTHEVLVGGEGDRLQRTMTVRQLTDVERWLNVATFYQGAEFLFEQITEEANELRPDFFVGINTTGLMIAAFLNGRLYGKEARPIGIVTTGPFRGSQKRSTVHMAPYELIDEHNDVLVVDSQFKRGRTSFQVIEEIKARLKKDFARKDETEGRSSSAKRRKLKNVQFSFAVLIACGIDVRRRSGSDATDDLATRKPIPITKLFRRPVNRLCDFRTCKSHLPDFLAFVSRGNVKAPKGMT